MFRVELAALQPSEASTLQLVLFAANQKGRSESVVLEDIAIRDAEKRTGEIIETLILTVFKLVFLTIFNILLYEMWASRMTTVICVPILIPRTRIRRSYKYFIISNTVVVVLLLWSSQTRRNIILELRQNFPSRISWDRDISLMNPLLFTVSPKRFFWGPEECP